MKPPFLLFLCLLFSVPLSGQIEITIDQGIKAFSAKADTLPWGGGAFCFDGCDTIDGDCNIVLIPAEYGASKLLANGEIVGEKHYWESYLAYWYIKTDSLSFLFLRQKENIIDYSIVLYVFNTYTCKRDFATAWDCSTYDPTYMIGDIPYYLRFRTFRFLIGKKQLQCFAQQIVPERESEKCIFSYDYKTKERWSNHN